MVVVIIAFLFLIIIGITAFLLVYYLTLFFGPPYVPSSDAATETLMSFAGIKSGEKAADLGAGNGKIVMALAKAGAEAHGYEINPFLVLAARIKIRRAGLQNKAFMHCKSFWRCDFSAYDLIYIYAFPYIMKKLEGKLQEKMKPKARVIANAFSFPNWQSKTKEGALFLYVKE